MARSITGTQFPNQGKKFAGGNVAKAAAIIGNKSTKSLPTFGGRSQTHVDHGGLRKA